MATVDINVNDKTNDILNVDLFADDDEDVSDDDNYRANRAVDGTQDVPLPAKSKKKSNLLSLGNFWSGRSRKDLMDEYDKRSLIDKNHLWDFMIYNNIREMNEGNYLSSVDLLETELSLSVTKARVAILSEISTNKSMLSVDLVEYLFDKHVSEMLKRLRIYISRDKLLFKSLDGSPITSDQPSSSIVDKFIKSHPEVIKLRNNIYTFREAKNKLIRNSLTNLLLSIEQLKRKVLNEMFEPNSPILKRCTMTRFLRQLDKISYRSEFFGEYRFYLLKNYVKYKKELDEYIENNATFRNEGDSKFDFTNFVNNFHPDLDNYRNDTDYFSETSSFRSRTKFDGDRSPANVEDTSNRSALDPDNIDNQSTKINHTNKTANTQDGSDDVVQQTNEVTTDVTPNTQNSQPNDDDLILIQEARRRAAEILKMKRLQRMQSMDD